MAINFDLAMPWAGMKRCNVRDNGTVAAYYGDSSFKYDGTNGQVMVEIPKFYFKKTVKTVGSDRTFEFAISDKAEPGFVLHPAFYRDRNGDGVVEEVAYRYYSAFEGYNNGGKLESKAGAVSTVNQTIASFRNQAQARGNGWGITDFNLLYAVQVLYLVEHGHFDSQSKIGKGITSDSAKHNTGETTSLGNTTGQGSGADGKRAMSYRGIENWYGNIRDWIDGCYYDASVTKIGNVGFNDAGTGYKSVAYVNPATSGSISDIQDSSDLGFIPKAFAGSNYNSHLYDYGTVNSGRVPAFGGNWAEASTAGAFWLVSLSPAYSDSSIGGRLAF